VKESPNGRVAQRLAGNKRRLCSPRGGGRNVESEKYRHWPVTLIGGGEREGLGGSLKSATDADGEPESTMSGARLSPLL
jgi:hypothetical protein